MSGWKYCEYGVVHTRCRCIDGRKLASEMKCTCPDVHANFHDSRVEFPQASKADLHVYHVPGQDVPSAMNYQGQLRIILMYLDQGRIDMAKSMLNAMMIASETTKL